MTNDMRKTRRRRNGRTRKRGGEVEDWNNAHINQYRHHRTVRRNRNLQHTQFISNISKKEYEIGLEEIRQRIYALMAEKDISDDKDRIQKEIDELTVLVKKIKKETHNKIVSLNEGLSEYVSNLEREHQQAKIIARINSMATVNGANNVVNSERKSAREFRDSERESAREFAKHIEKNISDYFPKDIYTVTIHRREAKHEGKMTRTVINIDNKKIPSTGFSCIQCEIYDYKPHLLHIAFLSRCGLNGTDHLNRLIAFCKSCGLSQIDLDDKSSILYDTKNDATFSDSGIDLQKQSRLMTGHSWYERFGFTNKAVEQYQSAIDDYIKKSIGTVVPTLLTRLQYYVPEITETTPVKDAVFFIYRDLNELCPKRKCPYKNNLDDVKKINEIIGALYKEMLIEIHAEEDNFEHLTLTLQQGSSRKTRHTKVNRTHRRKRTRRSRMYK